MKNVSNFINEHKGICKQLLYINDLRDCAISKDQLSKIHVDLFGHCPEHTYSKKVILNNIKWILHKYIESNGGL